MKIHIPDRHPRFGNAFGYSRWSDELRAALDQLGYHVEDACAADACPGCADDEHAVRFRSVRGLLDNA